MSPPSHPPLFLLLLSRVVLCVRCKTVVDLTRPPSKIIIYFFLKSSTNYVVRATSPIINSPATLQMMMNVLFCHLVCQGVVIVYTDSVLSISNFLNLGDGCAPYSTLPFFAPIIFPRPRSNNAPPPPVLLRDHYKIEVLDECFRCGRAEYLVKWNVFVHRGHVRLKRGVT
ncbi:hypothetical protein F5J12DRAFT_323543 [Pisolithus orientalis]|uniref:uncharacterized protein n=1 Tax=Pisolithus orientalis TaxID=936130 RepID=UPI0022240DC4|nr:uncharacterized protein F5J12DRAFT_323543 [Pisolithus orientalis]KAI5998355.1 hypothetical protein F5J12DRAFT_323543 [Pisolithus orientalis]